MTSPIVSKLLEQKYANEALAEFESDFTPSSVGLWEMAQEKAAKKFGHFPTAEGLDYAFGWYNLKEGYWRTEISEELLDEGTLHHWFKGSKSKDGKPGWVQADGSPCANEEGEDKTPKCFSSGRLAALKRKGKKGENKIKSAVRRKREEDPGQQQKSGGAKPTNVKTFAKGKKDKDYVKAEPKLKKEETELQEKKDIKGKGSGSKDACYHKVKARFKVFPSAYASGALVQCRKKGAANWGTKKEGYAPGDVDQKVGAVTAIPTDEREAARQRILAKALAAKKKREMKKEDTSEMDAQREQRILEMKQRKIAELSDIKQEESDESGYVDEGYIEFDQDRGPRKPSPRGKLVTKASQKRLGNILSPHHRDAKKQGERAEKMTSVRDTHSPEKAQAKAAANKAKGESKKRAFGNRLRRTDGQGIQDSYDYIEATNQKNHKEEIEEQRIPPQNGNTLMVTFTWRGKYLGMKVFFPETKMPTRSEVQEALDKVYPGCLVRHYVKTSVQPQDPYINVGVSEEVESVEEDWQKVNKSDKTDGMSKKAVAAYRRENPGSKLKTAVTGNPKRGSKDAKRRKSYCARSKGQQDMHNIDCSKTPDKPVCKARRRWKC